MKRPVGERLESIRSQRDISQREMAELIGVSLRFYSDLITGEKKPSFAVVDDAIQRLKMRASDFFEDEVPSERVTDLSAKAFLDAIDSVSQKIASLEVARLKKALAAIPEALRDVWKHAHPGTQAACMYLLTANDSFLMKSFSDATRKQLQALRPLLGPEDSSDPD